MVRHIFVLLFAGLVALEVDSTAIKNIKTKLLNIKPRDLVDEAEADLDDLKQTVASAIEAADNSLMALGTDFMSLGDQAVLTGTIAIQQEYQAILDKLTALKALAETAGVDYSSCTGRREEVIGEWATQYTGQIGLCIRPQNNQANQTLQDARYYVDVYINRVNNLEFQLGLCAPDSAACITPIVSQIETGMVQLPQEIQIEVDQVSAFFENLKPSVQRCSDIEIDEFQMDGNGQFTSIENCYSQLLS